MASFGRYSSENLFKDATSSLMGLKQLEQRKQIAGERTAIMKTQAETSAGHLKLAQEKQTAELQEKPVPERQFTTGEIAEFEAVGGALDKKLKGIKLSASITPVANAIKEYTEQGYKKIDISRALKKNRDEYKQPAMESLQKAMETAITSGDKKALAELTQMHTDISSNEFVDKMMPACARYEKDLMEAKPKPKEGKPQEKWTTTTLPSGARIQTETTTGKERKVLGRLVPKGERGVRDRAPRTITTWLTPEGKTINLPNNVQPPKGSVPYKDERLTEKDVAKAEEIIRTNPGNIAVKGQIGIHNRYSKQPYALIWHKGKEKPWYKPWGETDNVKQVDLPVMDGKQVTSNEVWLTAKNHTISFKEVLKRIGALK